MRFDDETDALDLMAQLLTCAHGEIEKAGSAAEAFQKYKIFSPDVVVSDIGMPVQDGYSLIKQIRDYENLHNRFTPAVALTAYAGEKDRNKALAAGFQAHMAKPVSSKELILIIKE